MSEPDDKIRKNLAKLDSILSDKKRLLILVHNNPDPDAIASAAALGYLAEARAGIKYSIAYGGIVGRAENREMVRKMKLEMKQVNRISFDRYDCIALVDTQPGSGNNSLPPGVRCDVVIDHHPKRGKKTAGFVVIEPGLGVTATLLVEWITASGLVFPADLSTGLAYAAISETQNLHRETTKRDIDAYLTVYVSANIRTLAQIINPKLTHSHFVSLAKALGSAYIYRNLIHAHIGEVAVPDVVAEMADFLLRHERISWCLVSGRYKDRLVISIRTSISGGKAHELVKSLVPDEKTVGGHETIAGGYIALRNGNKQELMELETMLSRGFAGWLGYNRADWKPLLTKI
ncbi:MAG: DHH family phosphoesterase [Spirochaetes bacterium]|nr:DHH family phosphoesterase [Spirochaetota bacterium]